MQTFLDSCENYRQNGNLSRESVAFLVSSSGVSRGVVPASDVIAIFEAAYAQTGSIDPNYHPSVFESLFQSVMREEALTHIALRMLRESDVEKTPSHRPLIEQRCQNDLSFCLEASRVCPDRGYPLHPVIATIAQELLHGERLLLEIATRIALERLRIEPSVVYPSDKEKEIERLFIDLFAKRAYERIQKENRAMVLLGFREFRWNNGSFSPWTKHQVKDIHAMLERAINEVRQELEGLTFDRETRQVVIQAIGSLEKLSLPSVKKAVLAALSNYAHPASPSL